MRTGERWNFFTLEKLCPDPPFVFTLTKSFELIESEKRLKNFMKQSIINFIKISDVGKDAWLPIEFNDGVEKHLVIIKPDSLKNQIKISGKNCSYVFNDDLLNHH